MFGEDPNSKDVESQTATGMYSGDLEFQPIIMPPWWSMPDMRLSVLEVGREEDNGPGWLNLGRGGVEPVLTPPCGSTCSIYLYEQGTHAIYVQELHSHWTAGS